MNLVVLMGRLTKSPKLRYTKSNQAYTRFTLAVDKQLTKDKKQELEANNQPTADFINCVAWNKTAEAISKYADKGLRVVVEGSIQTGSYENNGQRTYTTDVLINNVNFVEWKNKQQNNNNNFNNFDISEDFSDDFSLDDARIPF